MATTMYLPRFSPVVRSLNDGASAPGPAQGRPVDADRRDPRQHAEDDPGDQRGGDGLGERRRAGAAGDDLSPLTTMEFSQSPIRPFTIALLTSEPTSRMAKTTATRPIRTRACLPNVWFAHEKARPTSALTAPPDGDPGGGGGGGRYPPGGGGGGGWQAGRRRRRRGRRRGRGGRRLDGRLDGRLRRVGVVRLVWLVGHGPRPFTDGAVFPHVGESLSRPACRARLPGLWDIAPRGFAQLTTRSVPLIACSTG